MTRRFRTDRAPFEPDRRAVVLGALAACAVPRVAVAAGGGLVLIMVEEPGCVYCKKFDQEIGRGYSRTKEGQYAPLMRVRRRAAELKGLNPVLYTPTFILMRRGEEVGRITGYPGAEYFYSELEDLLSKVGFARGLTAGPSGT